MRGTRRPIPCSPAGFPGRAFPGVYTHWRGRFLCFTSREDRSHADQTNPGALANNPQEDAHPAAHWGWGAGEVPLAVLGWPLLTHPNPTINMVPSGQAVQVLDFSDALSGKALPALCVLGEWKLGCVSLGPELTGPCPKRPDSPQGREPQGSPRGGSQKSSHTCLMGHLDSQAANNGDPRGQRGAGCVSLCVWGVGRASEATQLSLRVPTMPASGALLSTPTASQPLGV